MNVLSLDELFQSLNVFPLTKVKPCCLENLELLVLEYVWKDNFNKIPQHWRNGLYNEQEYSTAFEHVKRETPNTQQDVRLLNTQAYSRALTLRSQYLQQTNEYTKGFLMCNHFKTLIETKTLMSNELRHAQLCRLKTQY